MDRRFLTVLGASVLFALVVSAIFYQFVAGSRRGARAAKAQLRDVVIATQALSPGIVISAADVKVAKAAVDEFPKGGFSKTADVVGRPVASSILAEEPVREGRLGARGSGLGLAPIIPPGMRAASVRVNEVVGVAGFVLPGMRVDVLVTGKSPHTESSMTRTILQDIPVLSAGKNIEAGPRGEPVNVPVVTLLVTPAQAEMLTLASEWRIQLVLRNGSDRTIEATPGRELAQIFGGAPPAPKSAPKPRPPQTPPPVAQPAPAPPAMEEIVVIRGTQKTVEQVRVKTP